MLKGHAILVVHQESWPSLVWWETHLAYPSFLSCPGAYYGLPALPLTFLSSLAQSHISPFNSPSLPLGPEASTHPGDSPSATHFCHQPLALPPSSLLFISSAPTYSHQTCHPFPSLPESVSAPSLTSMPQPGAHTFPQPC